MRAEHYEEALKWLQIAAAYKSNPAVCLTDLGYTYQHLGQVDQAVAQYRKAAGMGDADGQYYLATMYEKGTGLPKDAKQAVMWYRKAADQNSGEKANADVLNNVAWALATSSEPEVRSPAAALEYAQRAVAAEKGQPRAHILDTLAESYYVNGRYDEAVKTEQRALQVAQPAEKANYLKQLEKYQQAFSGNKQTANAE
jgi:tetratricopeptide (TPR) repeat protein